MVALTIEVPVESFVNLALLAEQRGHETVKAMLGEIADRLATVETAPRRSIAADRVIRLTLEGFTDQEIARSLNVTNEFVSRNRRDAGLTANKKRG